jgi:hypothetical protein
MRLHELKSAAREWMGDPSDDVISDAAIMFFILAALDFYGAQLVNAGKGTIEAKVTKQPTAKETTFSEEFAFGQSGYARLKVSETDAATEWEDLDIFDSIADLNDAERDGRRGIFFYAGKMVLSWTPVEAETIEIWGEQILFQNLVLSEEVRDIPGLFHHLVVENASKRGLTRFFKFPDLIPFARATQNELAESIEKREIIWRKYLAKSPDEKRRHESDSYTPLNDGFYSEFY